MHEPLPLRRVEVDDQHLVEESAALDSDTTMTTISQAGGVVNETPGEKKESHPRGSGWLGEERFEGGCGGMGE